jgi:hypothetical protein
MPGVEKFIRETNGRLPAIDKQQNATLVDKIAFAREGRKS